MAEPQRQLLEQATASARQVSALCGSTLVTREDASILEELMTLMTDALASVDAETFPQELAETWLTALDSCTAILEVAWSATSPEAVFLLSGPVGRALRTHLGEAASSYELIRSFSPGGGTGASVPPALQPEEVRELRLPAIDSRAAHADALYEQLQEYLAEGGQQQQQQEASRQDGQGVGMTLQDGRALECLVRALKEEGSSGEELLNAEGRRLLAAQLLYLGEEGGQWLTRAEREFVNTVAAVLSSTVSGGAAAQPDAASRRSSGPGSDTAGDGERAPHVESPSQSATAAPDRPEDGDGGGRLWPLQHSLLCPITQQVMRDPVTTAEGHTYERSAIEQWLRNNDTDPQTRNVLPSKTLFPSWAVKGAIGEWLAAAHLTHEQYDNVREEFVGMQRGNELQAKYADLVAEHEALKEQLKRHKEEAARAVATAEAKSTAVEALSRALKSQYSAGMRVTIHSVAVDVAKAVQDGYGGWNPVMAGYLGKPGTVARVDNRTVAVKMDHNDDCKVWNPLLLIPQSECAAAVQPQSQVHELRKEMLVLIKNCSVDAAREQLERRLINWNTCMGAMLGKVGEVLEIDGDGDVKVRMCDGGQAMFWSPAMLIPLVKGTKLGIRQLPVEVARHLQVTSGLCCWVDTMRMALGKEGTVECLHDAMGVCVRVEGDRVSRLWNPALLCARESQQ